MRARRKPLRVVTPPRVSPRRSHSRRVPNWAIGLAAVVVIAVASYLAYAKSLPWSHGYEVKAVFASAQNVRVNSPVRIAGVDVGEVTDVQPLTADSPEYEAAAGRHAPPQADAPSGRQAAVVTMEISDEGRPIHDDATFKLRPRLFLEGNMFVDVEPGSPGSPEADGGHTFPISQTSYSVQLDQVLTTLQAGVRSDLQTFLDQFGNALIRYKGAEGFHDLFRGSAGAYEYGSIVNEALLGTEPHDLSGLIRNLDVVVRALDRNESQLKGLVSSFRTVSGSFAAHDQALERAVALLPDVLEAARPAFARLNAAFPPLRAFAREALPGVRSTGPMIDAATPFIGQLRQLVSERELRGLTHDLRPTIPDLAHLANESIPFLEQSRRLASCFNEVVIPWSNDTVDPQDPSYPFAPAGTVSQETAYGLLGIAGESTGGDANGQTIRVEAGGGTNTVVMPLLQSDPNNPFDENAISVLPGNLLGAMPRVFSSPGLPSDSLKTRFKPKARCERQEPPDLSAGGLTQSQLPFRQEGQQLSAQDLAPPGLGDALAGVDRSRLARTARKAAALTEQGRPGAASSRQLSIFRQLQAGLRDHYGGRK